MAVHRSPHAPAVARRADSMSCSMTGVNFNGYDSNGDTDSKATTLKRGIVKCEPII